MAIWAVASKKVSHCEPLQREKYELTLHGNSVGLQEQERLSSLDDLGLSVLQVTIKDLFGQGERAIKFASNNGEVVLHLVVGIIYKVVLVEPRESYLVYPRGSREGSLKMCEEQCELIDDTDE